MKRNRVSLRVGATLGAWLALATVDVWGQEMPPPPRAVVVSQPPAPLDPIIVDESALAPGPLPATGCFFALDAEFLKPHVKYRLAAIVDFGGGVTDIVQLPSAPLEGAIAPRFEVGYQLPNGFGSLVAAYRPMHSQGDAELIGFGTTGDGSLHTRLDVQVVNLDWVSPEWSHADIIQIQAHLGGQFVNIYTDSLAFDSTLEQHSSNYYYGAGPHVGLDYLQQLTWPGFALFVRADGSATFGQVRQSFEEVVSTPTVLAGAAAREHKTRVVPIASFEAGLNWASRYWADQRVNFAFGYACEYWWHFGDAGGSQASLWAQGVFFRSEWRY